MAGQIDKGKITSIDGNVARVVPCNEPGLVSASVVIPWHLRGTSGNLSKGTEVVYALFEDQTGILLGRADGNWGNFVPELSVETLRASSVTASGVSLAAHSHSVTEGATQTGNPT
ncbi:MAG: hypothetical protein IJ680_07680 [Paludibacteraceae bacterium]|nr:hypothetical protein [Eubacterium sp.]MBR1631721.1 hypothetical protein [Paludibacteraceae bacterium]